MVCLANRRALGSIHIICRVNELAVLGYREVQMRPHAALSGGGAAHQADDIPGSYLVALLHRWVLLQAAGPVGLAPKKADARTAPSYREIN